MIDTANGTKLKNLIFLEFSLKMNIFFLLKSMGMIIPYFCKDKTENNDKIRKM